MVVWHLGALVLLAHERRTQRLLHRLRRREERIKQVARREICYYGSLQVRLRRFGGVDKGLADMKKQGIGHSPKRTRTLHYLVTSLIKAVKSHGVYIPFPFSLSPL